MEALIAWRFCLDCIAAGKLNRSVVPTPPFLSSSLLYSALSSLPSSARGSSPGRAERSGVGRGGPAVYPGCPVMRSWLQDSCWGLQSMTSLSHVPGLPRDMRVLDGASRVSDRVSERACSRRSEGRGVAARARRSLSRAGPISGDRARVRSSAARGVRGGEHASACGGAQKAPSPIDRAGGSRAFVDRGAMAGARPVASALRGCEAAANTAIYRAREISCRRLSSSGA